MTQGPALSTNGKATNLTRRKVVRRRRASSRPDGNAHTSVNHSRQYGQAATWSTMIS